MITAVLIFRCTFQQQFQIGSALCSSRQGAHMVQIPAFRKQHLQKFPDSAVFCKRPVTFKPVKKILQLRTDLRIRLPAFRIKTQQLIQTGLLPGCTKRCDLFLGKQF